jgi:hypothetical protein
MRRGELTEPSSIRQAKQWVVHDLDAPDEARHRQGGSSVSQDDCHFEHCVAILLL